MIDLSKKSRRQPQLELCCGPNKNHRQSPKLASNRWQPAAILNPGCGERLCWNYLGPNHNSVRERE